MAEDEMSVEDYRALMGLPLADEDDTLVVASLDEFLEKSPALTRLTEQARREGAQKKGKPQKKQRKRASQKERYTDLLLGDLRMAGLPAPVREHRFHPTRRWRFDLAWPDEKIKLAVEIDGGGYSNPIKCPGCGANTGQRAGGRHHRPEGYAADAEKFAEAALLGWRVIRVVPRQIDNGKACKWIASLLVSVESRQVINVTYTL